MRREDGWILTFPLSKLRVVGELLLLCVCVKKRQPFLGKLFGMFICVVLILFHEQTSDGTWNKKDRKTRYRVPHAAHDMPQEEKGREGKKRGEKKKRCLLSLHY